jgi:CelD/BcsL family acetyltransferase involved in cellulose biosynthesis
MNGSLRALLSGLIDYAGLFPPAALPMSEAVANYAAYRDGADAWALARFVVPVMRLGEFEADVAPHLHGEPWRLSVLAQATDADTSAPRRGRARRAGRRPRPSCPR